MDCKGDEMKDDVFVVIGFDTVFNGEEVSAVFSDIYKAEEYRKANGKLRTEHHTLKDGWPPSKCPNCGKLLETYCRHCFNSVNGTQSVIE